jgi:hypothetical protein
MKRIHVVGVSPRSGTTLMTEALKTCFDIDYSTSHEDRLFTRAPGQPDIFLSKSPKDILVVGPSLKVDPQLYVICLIRDPRDVISSKHKKDPDRYWAGLKFWNYYSKELPKLYGHPRFITIRYEHFVSNPDEVQQIITNRIPFLEKTISFSRYHEEASVSGSSKEALSGVRPIKPTSIGRWTNHKARIAGQIQLHGSLTEDLITHGYEQNAHWLKKLEGVGADLTPSHFSEYWTFKDKILLRAGRFLEATRRIIETLIRRRIRITHPKKWVTKK